MGSATKLLAAEDAISPQHLSAMTERYCVDCHGEFLQEAGLRLNTMRFDATDAANLARWLQVYDRVADGEMPPADAEHPSAEEREQFVAELSQSLARAELRVHAESGRVPLRRLNRVEYEWTLRDLLSQPHLELKEMLPPDPSVGGIETVATAQDFSYVQMSRYLDASRLALDAAMDLKSRPQPINLRLDLQKQSRLTRDVNTKWGKIEPDARRKDGRAERGEVRWVDEWSVFVRQPNSAQTPYFLTHREPVAEGLYRFRCRCRGVEYDHGSIRDTDQNHVLSLYSGESRLLKTWDVANKPRVVEFTAWLKDGDGIELYCASLDDRNTAGAGKMKPYAGPGIAVDYLEMEGPLIDQWPADGHRLLFGDLRVIDWREDSGFRKPMELVDTGAMGKRGSQRREKSPPRMVQSAEPAADAERLLRRFMNRAYRRPADEAEVQRCLAFATRAIEDRFCFQDAMRLAYQAALSSPDFLFLREQPGELDDFALASRLSYFLWRSLPDDELRALADAGRLSEPDVLREQVERLLNDRRSERFIIDFCDQWLDLREVSATAPDQDLYPEYFCDNHLVESVVKEARAYVGEMVSKNLGAAAIVDSDFAMLNERLAEHYDINGVLGSDIRRVELPEGSVRGGLLTQAAIMKITANGLTSSPVTRGAWVLDNILGTPPPPPPPNAGAIEPDTQGATTIRDLLEKHRRVESCAACHRLIDPPGFALENFDVMGAWRERYRSFGKGDPVKREVADRRVKYRLAARVDASGKTIEGVTFDDVEGLRTVLLEQEEQIARNMTERLLTLATGGSVAFSDRTVVEQILERTESENYGLRSIIREIVLSQPFRRK
ncbi:DUF1592 domain-containing protein [Stratiformator vulcanicus]|nr:DUF1592 domain-containing protein [Stratiformator vulcanicus]